MSENKHVKSVNLYRSNGVVAIDVVLPDNSRVSLYEKSIEYFAKYLSEIELEESVMLLLEHKKAMLKQRNFPPLYEEMLSDLIKVQEERYGMQDKKDKRRKLTVCIDPPSLEKMFEQNFNIIDVRIKSIDCGGLTSEWKHLTLSMQFREVREDE